MKKLLHILSMAGLLSSTAFAANWNESLQGDLSDSGNAPTPIAFELGVNLVSGTMGKDLPQDPVDRDIFTFTLGPGLQLTSIHFLVFEPTNQSFYALAPGSTINTGNPATHLANTLVKGTFEETGDVLTKLVNNGDSQGGGTWPALPISSRVVDPGTYSIWLQELSSVATYQTAYTVTAVPEPSTYGFYALVALAAGALLWKRRRLQSPARCYKEACLNR